MDFLLSVLTGGGFGIIGSVVNKVMGIWQSYEERQKLKISYEHELNLQKLNIKARAQELESEERIAEYGMESAVRTASYAHDTGYGQASQKVINFLRLVRPILTFMLLAVTGIVLFTIAEGDLIKQTVNQITFMTTLAITWWFGDRSSKPGPIK